MACALVVSAASAVQAASPETETRAGELQLAQSLFAIEQLDELYQVTTAATVYQRPDLSSPELEILPGNSAVRVTGRITGTDWYRVWTNKRAVGYVKSGNLKAAAGPAGSIGQLEGQSEGRAGSRDVSPAERPQIASLRDDLPEGVFSDCPGCPQMVALPQGSFTMGSAAGEPSEQPERQVKIGYSFALGRFEVTVAEWQACVAAGACSGGPDSVARPEATPLRNVSGSQAQAFVDWLKQTTGKPYRLPSEAEWEYAARAGSSGPYWWGQEAGSGRADCKDCGGDWNRKAPGAIGRFPANPFGLHDMNGGVAEWTADCWFDSYAGAGADPKARDKKNCLQRVLRGGSWKQEAAYLSSSSRHFYDAEVPYSGNGFRVALTLN